MGSVQMRHSVLLWCCFGVVSVAYRRTCHARTWRVRRRSTKETAGRLVMNFLTNESLEKINKTKQKCFFFCYAIVGMSQTPLRGEVVKEMLL